MRPLRRQSRTEEVPVIPEGADSNSGVIANYQQVTSKVVAKPIAEVVANHQQSGSKVVAEVVANHKQSGSKVVAQPIAEVVANYQQSGSKVVAKTPLSQLSGLQLNLLQILYHSCRNHGQKYTQPLSVQHLQNYLKTSTGTVKNAIHRLIHKEIIAKYESKNGRGGWTQYKIENFAYAELLQFESDSKVVANYQQSGSKVVAQPIAQPIASLPSSNSSNIINTITTREDDWVQLIQTPLNLKNLGLGQGHIKQLKEKFFLTPEQIQHGLEAFAYDLEKGELERLKSRGVQNIIGYFFGAMKSGGYNPINEGFITAEDLAEKEMIERLENRKKERKERSEKLIDLLFAEWLETKSREELIKIQNPIHQYLDMFHKADLKNHFKKNEMELFRREF